MAELYRYAAFISYSSKDAAFARRLHRALESYGIPASLGKFDLIGGGKANRVYPVFRDREELAAGHLGEVIEANLRASSALIVVCSPSAAASPWVQKEIEYFAGLGRGNKIFAIIPDNAPLSDANGGDATPLCFPAAFRGDALSGDGLEPLAADARRGKDGFRNAWLKLVAGLIGVSPGQLIDRDERRRRTRRAQSGVAIVVAGVLIGLALEFFDARAWRTAMISTSRDYYINGLNLDSLPLAIAGTNAFGDIIGIDGAQADAAIERRPETGLVFDFGDAGFMPEFSPDGRYVSVQTEEDRFIVVGPGVRYELSQVTGFPVFSPSEAELAFADGDGSYLLNLRDGQRTRLGESANFIRFSASGAVLSLQNFDSPGASRVVSLNEATPLAVNGVISNDGQWIAGGDSEGRGVVRNLATGQVWRFGALNAERSAFEYSPDGNFLATVAADGGWQLLDLRNGRGTHLGSFDGFGPRYSSNSHWLVGVSESSLGFVLDLKTGAQRQLGAVEEILAAPDGEHALIRYAEAPAQYTDLRTGETRSMGRVIDWAAFSADGSALLVQQREPAHALVLALPAGELRFDLGETFANPEFTADGARVVGRTMEGVGFVIDLASGARAEFGYLADSRTMGSALSADSRLLGTWDRSYSAYVLDMDRTFQSLERGVTAHGICISEAGKLVRPFPRELRDPSFASEDPELSRRRAAVFGQLQGRPWNPCDWRGLGAIFPDSTRGDGWFEGLRQWWRLRMVRWGLAHDYACAQVNARGEVRPERERSCAVRRNGQGGGRL